MNKRWRTLRNHAFALSMYTLMGIVLISASQGCFNASSMEGAFKKNILKFRVDTPILAGEKKKVKVIIYKSSTETEKNGGIGEIEYDNYGLAITLLEGQGNLSFTNSKNGNIEQENFIRDDKKMNATSTQSLSYFLKGRQDTQNKALEIPFTLHPDATTLVMKVKFELITLDRLESESSTIITWQAGSFQKENQQCQENGLNAANAENDVMPQGLLSTPSSAKQEVNSFSEALLTNAKEEVKKTLQETTDPITAQEVETIMKEAQLAAEKEITKELNEEAEKVAASKKATEKDDAEAIKMLTRAAKTVEKKFKDVQNIAQVRQLVENARQAEKRFKDTDKEANSEIEKLGKQLMVKMKEVGMADTDEEREIAENEVKQSEVLTKQKFEELAKKVQASADVAKKERKKALNKLKEISDNTEAPKLKKVIEKAKKAVEIADKTRAENKKILEGAYNSTEKIINKISNVVAQAQESKKTADIRDRVLGSIIPSLLVSIVVAAVIGSMSVATMGAFGGIVVALIIVWIVLKVKMKY